MSSVKQQVLEAVQQLPDDCTFEDVQYRLYVIETIRKRSELADRGEFATDQELKERLGKWIEK